MNIAEAAQATEMITKILSRHDMTEDDISEYQNDDAGAVQGEMLGKTHTALSQCWRGITTLTETTAYKNGAGSFYFVGMIHDVEMAMYLSEMITAAADRALKAGFPRAKATEKKSFYLGFGEALIASFLFPKR